MQDHPEEATLDCQSRAVVVDKAKLPELIHEMTDSRQEVPFSARSWGLPQPASGVFVNPQVSRNAGIPG